MLLMAVVMTLPLLTMTSCSNDDDPAPEGWPPAQNNVIDLSTLKAADLPGATLTLKDGDRDEDDPNAYKGNTWVYTPW